MSHVTTIKVEFKDLEAIKETCKILGLEFRENQKTYRWYGHHVGDYPLPQGITKQDLGKCDHAIGIKGSKTAYEMGLVKQGDHYVPIFDFWSGGYGLMEKIGEDANKFVSTYTKLVAVKQAKSFARSEGWTISEKYDEATEETVISLRKYD
jgi:hypothetical protein